MKMKVYLIFVISLIGLTSGQFKSLHRFGNFQSTPSTRSSFNKFQSDNSGQYRNNNDGQYVRVEDGQYRADLYNTRDNLNDGRYIHDDSGKYIHMNSPYDGGFGDKGHRGGYYDGDNGKYQHIDGPNGQNNFPLSRNFNNIQFGTTTPKAIFNNVVTKVLPSPKTYTNYNDNNDKNNNIKNRGEIQYTGASRFRTYGNEGGWRILRLDKDIDPISYSYAYETENKIIGEEIGQLDNSGNGNEGVRTSGFYEYEGDDGKTYRVDYTADENGFIPKGDHIPAAISQALEHLASSKRY